MSFSFSYDFNLGPPAAKPLATPRLADLVAADRIRLFPLGGDEQLVLNTQTRQRTLVKNNLLPALSLCGQFRTLDEHCAAILADPRYASLSGAEVMAVLRQLRAGGVLVDAERWLDRFPAASSSAAAESAIDGDWRLVISTCDRPALLKRLLDSAVPYLLDGPRPERAILIDDSRDPAHRAANRRAWTDWLARCRLEGDDWDRAARANLARTLARRFPERADILDWLLSPDALPETVAPYGQIKNLTLLLTAGRRALLLDDDCMLQPRGLPAGLNQDAGNGCERGARIGHRPLDAVLHADRDTLLAAVEPLSINPLAAHLEILGRSPAEVFAALNQPWRAGDWLRTLDASTIARLSPEVRVRASVNGVLGDPGTGTMDWLYLREGDSRARIAAFLEAMSPDGLNERLLWKGRRATLLTFDSALMTTTLTGLDNRALLPCGLPFGRGADDVFGRGVKALYPETLSCEFAWSLPHLPDPPRGWRRPDRETLPAMPDPVWFCEKALYQAADGCQARDPEARLGYLADVHLAWAADPDALLGQRLEEIWVNDRASRLRGYRANAADIPDSWAVWRRDIAILIERTAGQAAMPLQYSPEWREAFRDLLGRHGAALRLWPELIGAFSGPDGESPRHAVSL